MIETENEDFGGSTFAFVSERILIPAFDSLLVRQPTRQYCLMAATELCCASTIL